MTQKEFFSIKTSLVCVSKITIIYKLFFMLTEEIFRKTSFSYEEFLFYRESYQNSLEKSYTPLATPLL